MVDKTKSFSHDKIASDLRGLVSGDVLVDVFNRIAFSTDSSIYQIIPQCVVAVSDIGDVINVVKYAEQMGLPIAPRGAGSGLAGECLSDGIVIDFTRYMNKIIGLEQDGEIVICEPGAVLDQINAFLKPYNKKIGPDPSSGNRAVIGGVVSNNATGAHSLQYGYISDFVERIEAVMYDGSVVEFVNDYDPQNSPDNQLKEIALGCLSLLENKQSLIDGAQPRTKRNRCGYTIQNICHDGKINLAQLMAGSEGTLGIFTRIALRTVDIPKCKALIQLEFDTFDKTAKAVPIVVDSGASACEMMDKSLIDMAIDALPQYRDIFPANCAASLLIEHVADDMDELAEKLVKTESMVGSLARGSKKVYDPEQQKKLWKSRKDAVPLLHREKGRAHPVPFIEDVSVDNALLDKYVEGLQEIGKKYDIPMAFYGHAGDGELHIRPYLDLSRPDEVQRMRHIATDVFELAWSLGGSISGEHADGILRAGFIEKQYGTEYYTLLKQIKDLFDPANRLNPGKIINDDPDAMVKNLRGQHTILQDRVKTNLLFKEGEFRNEIEQCNGDGVCLACAQGSRMCPVFRATGQELASSRGKANLLRAWITGLLEPKDFESPEFQKIVGLCVNCKMCSVECPSKVDISKLVMEARAEFVRRNGLSLTETALSKNRFLSIMGTAFSPLSNLFANLSVSRFVIEKILGLDKRRGLPAFARGTFARKARRYLAKQPKVKNPIDKVVYFVDSYANFNDHELGWAVLHVLRHNQIEVVIPEQRPAPIPAMVYGDLKTVKKDLEYNMKQFLPYIHKGYKVICSEPSAALCLTEDLSLVLDTDESKLFRDNTIELMSYLFELNQKELLKKNVNAISSDMKYAYHAPCHLIALGHKSKSIQLLEAALNIRLKDIEAGCCGLAGTCGMKKSMYDISVQIGREMADAINAMDTPYAVTECGACKMQIEHLTDKKVLHPVKLLAKAYGLI